MCGQVELQRDFPVVFPRMPYVYVHIYVCVAQCTHITSMSITFPQNPCVHNILYTSVNVYTCVCGPAKLQRHFPVHSLCIHKYAYIHMHMDTCTYMWPSAIATSLSSRFS